MCLPAAAILTAVSTGLGMIAQHQQTKAQVSMYKAQAQAAEANKRISDRKQEQIAIQQLQERDKMDNRMRLVAGTNAAEAGGLQMAGSPLQLMASSYDEYNKDIYNWEQNKNNAIYNEYLNGMNYQNEANAARASAKNARRQGNLAMVSSILGAASSMYGIKQQYAGGKMKTTYGGDPVGYTDRGPVVTVKRDYKMR